MREKATATGTRSRFSRSGYESIPPRGIQALQPPESSRRLTPVESAFFAL